MGGLADRSQEGTVAGEPRSIASRALAWLEQRLEVIEHQQTGPIPKQLEQCCELPGLALGCDHLLVRQEPDRVDKQLRDGWHIAQAAPVGALECRRHIFGQFRGETGLADAAHAQHAYHSTVLPQHPVANQGKLVDAAYETEHIGSIPPVLAPCTPWSEAERGFRRWAHRLYCRRAVDDTPADPRGG